MVKCKVYNITLNHFLFLLYTWEEDCIFLLLGGASVLLDIVFFLGPGTSANPCSDLYPGKQASSEMETKTLSEYISSLGQLFAYLDFHSDVPCLLIPFSDTKTPVHNQKDLVSSYIILNTLITLGAGHTKWTGRTKLRENAKKMQRLNYNCLKNFDAKINCVKYYNCQVCDIDS